VTRKVPPLRGRRYSAKTLRIISGSLATPSPGKTGSANNGLTLTHPLLVPARLQLVELAVKVR
jgi:hypothetical protein